MEQVLTGDYYIMEQNTDSLSPVSEQRASSFC